MTDAAGAKWATLSRLLAQRSACCSQAPASLLARRGRTITSTSPSRWEAPPDRSRSRRSRPAGRRIPRNRSCLIDLVAVNGAMVYVTVTSVEVLDHYRLRLGFSDGSQRDVDLTGALHDPVFEPLVDPDFFAQVRVDEELTSIHRGSRLVILGPRHLERVLASFVDTTTTSDRTAGWPSAHRSPSNLSHRRGPEPSNEEIASAGCSTSTTGPPHDETWFWHPTALA